MVAKKLQIPPAGILIRWVHGLDSGFPFAKCWLQGNPTAAAKHTTCNLNGRLHGRPTKNMPRLRQIRHQDRNVLLDGVSEVIWGKGILVPRTDIALDRSHKAFRPALF